MKVAIEPVEVWPTMATQIEISGIIVSLDNFAACSYVLLDDFDNPISQVAQAALTPAQYAQWGTDDSFFISAILSNLNLTPA